MAVEVLHIRLTVNVKTTCWCRRNMAAQKWKFKYAKVEVIRFIVNRSRCFFNLTTRKQRKNARKELP